MPLKILREDNHFLGLIRHDEKEYQLISKHPYNLLKDANISWESKGCLSYLMLLEDEIDLPISVIKNLIEAGYLVEVKE